MSSKEYFQVGDVVKWKWQRHDHQAARWDVFVTEVAQGTISEIYLDPQWPEHYGKTHQVIEHGSCARKFFVGPELSRLQHVDEEVLQERGERGPDIVPMSQEEIEKATSQTHEHLLGA